MFIVKVVKADDSYELHEAVRVHVQESKVNGTSAECHKPFVAPDFDLFLDKWDDAPGKLLLIGNGEDHFAHAYIMNESGKTVDVVSWRYDQSLAPQIGKRRVA